MNTWFPHRQAEEDRKAAAKALLEEVAQSNKRLEQRRVEMKQAEVEEDQRIAEYLRLKEAHEQVCCVSCLSRCGPC